MATWDSATVSAVTLSGGDLVATNTGTTSTNQGAHVAFAGGKTTGKFYFEVTITAYTGGAGVGLGVGNTSSTFSGMSSGSGTGYGYELFVRGHTGSGTIFLPGGNSGLSLGARNNGDVIGVAVDITNGRTWFRLCPAGAWNGGTGTQDPTLPPGTGGGLTGLSGTIVPFCTFGSGPAGAAGVAGNVFTANFGATAFVGTPPSGYSAWELPPSILTPGLITDADAIYAPVAISTSALLPALVTDTDAIYAPVAISTSALLPALVTDADVVYAPGIANTSQFLQPAAVADADTISAATLGASASLLPTLYAADDAFFSASVIAGSAALSAALVTDTDAFYAPSIVAQQITGQVLQPGLVAADDVIVTASVSGRNELQPALLSSDDAIQAPDLGWRLFGQLLNDVDFVNNPHVETLTYLLPETINDETESVDNYPFFIQAVSGGIPVPPPSGVLSGSISYPRRMTGSLDRRSRLTGSITRSTRVLTGSLKR